MSNASRMTASAVVSDRAGRFEMRTLSPGPYLVRAHLTGFVASRGQVVDVRPSGRSASAIALRHVNSAGALAGYPVLAAGVAAAPEAAVPPADSAGPADPPSAPPPNDDHGEVAWRLRHARRGVLKDATLPADIMADDTPDANIFGPISFLGRAMGSPARLATDFFTSTPFTGQVNFLTTGSFDAPQQFFTVDSFARGVAYMT